ncbi:MAG TPA: DUF2089 domain-containing protein [Pseudogracilibacillus sp.]|nr:DUF2089 domain-containing protein [Pseudogracilibacillus sp.]
MYPMINECPVCEKELHVVKLKCSSCHTTIENTFRFSKFASLSKEQLHFIELFLINRGNIKEVEKALNVSYPTVRAKLDNVINVLQKTKETSKISSAEEVLKQLEKGEINAEEAIRILSNP